ncbi:MAG: adenine phosphoribosyltransferase [Actinomycetia bacterium]|nr:adenine phosphoribosyltransferase [Actinomycetes bacterium]
MSSSGLRVNFDDVRAAIRDVPDFPKKGIVFKDITTLWQDKEGFKRSVDDMAAYYKDNDIKIDKIIGAEARGFVIGAALAYALGVGFIPVRKKGKLPYDVIEEEYALEYGTDVLQIHTDAITKGEKILVVDDLIATGGTCHAIANLIKRLGGEIAGFAFLVELEFLKGIEQLEDYSVFSLIKF